MVQFHGHEISRLGKSTGTDADGWLAGLGRGMGEQQLNGDGASAGGDEGVSVVDTAPSGY